MKKLEYQVSFTTPAFLGNAEQQAQWRTPPFKALLRQWWRVTYAADHRFQVNLAEMRREEGLLFGHAWLDDDRDDRGQKVSARKSLVRVRLDVVDRDPGKSWEKGTQKGVAPLPTDLTTSYAWFGLARRGANQPDRTGIKPGDREGQRILRLSFPVRYEQRFEQVMRLIHAFGQLGSRSRGGWGSLRMAGLTPFLADECARFAREWTDCLRDDWAISLGSDEKGVWIWESERRYDRWDLAMKDIAIERRRIRTALKSVGGRDVRVALGFAATGRMPSPLRWKVVESSSRELKVRAFVLPHKVPADSGKHLPPDRLVDAWRTACAELDASGMLKRGV